jgi:hypothetical protein
MKTMKSVIWIGLGIFVVIALVVAGLAAGWALWGRQLWATAPSYAMGSGTSPQDCDWGYGSGRGPAPGGMMPGGATPRGSVQGLPCIEEERQPSESSSDLTIEDAHEAVERYLSSRGFDDLELTEVMEFEHNFYAIAQEHDTGVGAMELLVDKQTGAVGPEMGPNMMWNDRYGMHGRGGMMGGMMRGYTEGNSISDEEAAAIAQRWLNANRPGVTVEEQADPFYGYYTFHTLWDENGKIEGMLSVHGDTGRVWYHTWHGDFIQMIETEAH